MENQEVPPVNIQA